MNKFQILHKVIDGLIEIPLPKDGKTIGIGPYKREIEGARRLARRVQWSDNIEEMRENYKIFRDYVDLCIKQAK